MFVLEDGCPRTFDDTLANLKRIIDSSEKGSNHYNSALANFRDYVDPGVNNEQAYLFPYEPIHPYSSECVLPLELMPRWYGDYLRGYEHAGRIQPFQQVFITIESFVAVCTVVTIGNQPHELLRRIKVVIDDVLLSPNGLQIDVGSRAVVFGRGLQNIPRGSKIVVFVAKAIRQVKKVGYFFKHYELFGVTAFLTPNAYGAQCLIVSNTDPSDFPGIPSFYIPRVNSSSLDLSDVVIVNWTDFRKILMNPNGAFVETPPRSVIGRRLR